VDIKSVTAAAPATASPAAAIPQGVGCRFVFKSTEGPITLTNAANVDSSVDAWLYQWTADSRADSGFDTVDSDKFPAIDTAGIYVAQNCLDASKCGDVSFTGLRMPFRSDGASTPTYYTPNQLIMDYYNYEQSALKYEEAATKAQEDFDKDALFSWIWFSFAPTLPEYVGAYSGKVWAKLDSLGGWGDYSIQPYVSTAAGDYPYGASGKATTEINADHAFDINDSTSAARYAAVIIYNTDVSKDGTTPYAYNGQDIADTEVSIVGSVGTFD
jgi:hypothetical protein